MVLPCLPGFGVMSNSAPRSITKLLFLNPPRALRRRKMRPEYRLLRAAMRASREHFRHEERDLFPLLEQALGLGVLTALSAVFKKASKAKTKRAQPAGLGP
jgi:hypothetical protein